MYAQLVLTLPSTLADPFADAAQEEDTSGVDYVHIRIQQRNGKKSLTTVQVCVPAVHGVPHLGVKPLRVADFFGMVCRV